MKELNKPFLFIAGTNKAGTTSLFEYLAAHPAIGASTIKQTRYFFDQKEADRSESDLLNQFYQQVNKASTTYLLEGTPDHLYDEAATRSIAKVIGREKAHFIFILRDPVERMFSWFNYGKQSGVVPEEETFATFVEKNEQADYELEPYTALETGQYSKHLPLFFDLFPKENIHIYNFAELKEDAAAFLQRMAKDLKIDPAFYVDYNFEQQNKTVRTKSSGILEIYRMMRRTAFWLMLKFPFVSRLFQPLIPKFRNAYRSINTAKVKKQDLQPQVVNQLRNYFQADKERLQTEFSFKAKWP